MDGKLEFLLVVEKVFLSVDLLAEMMAPLMALLMVPRMASLMVDLRVDLLDPSTVVVLGHYLVGKSALLLAVQMVGK